MTETLVRKQNEKNARCSMILAVACSLVAMGWCAAEASGQTVAGPARRPVMLASAESPFAATRVGEGLRLDLPVVAESSSTVGVAVTALPEAPSALLGPEPETKDRRAVDSSPTAPYASKFTKYIPANERGMKITGRDKVGIGLKDLVSPFSILGIVVTAGYAQVINGEPNYGVDKGAFGQRLWATAVRDSTEGFFTDCVMSPLLHEDPRYYVEGPQFSVAHRVLYSATRPLITRTDSGHASLNAALLLGYLEASALSYAYYPKSNQTFHDTASTYGGSIGGAALGDLVSEFADQLLQAVHLEKRP